MKRKINYPKNRKSRALSFEKASAAFWSSCKRDTKTQCLIWRGKGRVGKGYAFANFSAFGTSHQLAHRVAYRLGVGDIPKGKIVCHHCDNKLCVNPNHLFVGTHLDNKKDAMRKNRHARGEAQGAARLTENQVVIARALLVGRITPRMLAKKFGVHPTTLSAAVRGLSWKHVAL